MPREITLSEFRILPTVVTPLLSFSLSPCASAMSLTDLRCNAGMQRFGLVASNEMVCTDCNWPFEIFEPYRRKIEADQILITLNN